MLLPAEIRRKIEINSISHSASGEADEIILGAAPSKKLLNLQNAFKKKLQDTLINIKAEIHTRLALGVSCIPLILIGIALGVMFRGGHMLTAFGISSIPAVLLVVFLMMGKNVTKHKDLSAANFGLFLIWSGCFVLVLLALHLYRKLLKN